MQKVTIKDIAELAGVSRGTVDRVLNGRGRVASATQEKVWKIARQMGYEKNILASSLASNKIIDLAVIIPQGGKRSYWNLPVTGISERIHFYRHHGIECQYFYFETDSVASFESSMEKAIASKPSAILMAPVFLKETLKYLQVVSQNEIPVFTINTEIKHEEILSYIGQDSFGCGKIAGRLFHQSLPDIQKIICITPGHSKENAQHTFDKIDGLSIYFEEQNKQVVVEEIFIQEYKSTSAYHNWEEQLKMKGIGIFITNARAHYLLNVFGKSLKANNNIIIGFDLVPGNVEHLIAGNIDFILHQNPEIQGSQAVENIVNHFIYNKAINKANYVPSDIIIKENYKYYL